MFAPSSVHVLGFDPYHGADQARNYAGKYASMAVRESLRTIYLAWAFFSNTRERLKRSGAETFPLKVSLRNSTTSRLLLMG